MPAIHDPKIAVDVCNRALGTPLTITCQELLSLAPEVCTQLCEAISSRHIPTKDSAPTLMMHEPLLMDEDLSYLLEDEITLFDQPPVPVLVDALSKPTVSSTNLLEDAIIIDDPIDQYYRNLKPGKEPDPNKLVVAVESSALRLLVSLINNTSNVECMLDPGCQIIAMSEDVCHELALPYDPTIVLRMQSTNGNVDHSLGLARNIPFVIRNLTLYMQVHVIRSPAYNILLGRPFDVLTESVVRNFRNEDQTITIHDPNSEKVITLPTIPRGPPHVVARNYQSVFRR